MLCNYAFDMQNMLHILNFENILLAFDLQGNLKGRVPPKYYNFREVDVLSVLQEQDMCEIGVLSNSSFSKATPTLSVLNNWLTSLPVDKICVLKQRVAPDGYKTLYLFQKGRLAPFLPVR